jgi:ABC-type transport system substrate-binding protein
MGRLDRRALFTSGAAAALLAATGTSLAATPRAGGTLKLAVPREGGMLDLAAKGAVYETLTEIAPDGILRGELAESWSAREDGRVWTFSLRPGAAFHDGSPFTAADAAASLLAHGIAGARALDTLVLQVELAEPDAGLPYRLAAPELIMAPAGHADLPLAEANGTGCYRVERAQAGRSFKAVRVPGHWKSGQAGWVDTVEIAVIPDPAVRAEALLEGYVDVAALPDPEGLIRRGEFLFHPSAQDMIVAVRQGVGVPQKVGRRAALDDGRIAERWWRV